MILKGFDAQLAADVSIMPLDNKTDILSNDILAG